MFGRRNPGRVLVAALLALALMAPLFSISQAAPSSVGLERVIVGLTPSAGDPATFARSFTGSYSGQLGFVYQRALRGFAALLPAAAVQALSRDPRVAFVEPDFTVQAFAQTIPTGVLRIEANQNPATGIGASSPINVNADIAIVDTGIGPNSDLNVVGGANCLGSYFYVYCVNSNYADDNGHGTHVAGTAAAMNNGSGVVGVAPGARLWAVKVLNSKGSGYISQIVAGIDWVINQGNIEVINMSLGCQCTSQSLTSAVQQALSSGIVVVAAAGNDGQNASGTSPANIPGVIAVSAVADYNGQPGGGASTTCSNFGPDDSLASFSNYGSVVSFAAPGVCILSTLPNNQYGVMSGTSMASPHVAGAAVLYIASHSVASSPTRWQTVRSGMQAEWSVPQSSPCGFTGGKSSEPMLLLAPCTLGSPTTGTITGQVTNASTSSPISGATVAVSGGPSTTTASNGTYTLNNVTPGSVSVTASATGYVTSSPRTVTVTAGQTTSGINFALTPNTGTITGKVTDASTSGAIAGATVSVQGGPSTTTASDGTYTLNNVPAGNSVSVTASATGYASQTQTANVTAGQTTANVNFQLTPTSPPSTTGTISGVVTYQFFGTPISGATIRVLGTSFYATTGSNGQYQISGIPAGSYWVTATAFGYSGQTKLVTVQAGSTTTVNFALRRY